MPPEGNRIIRDKQGTEFVNTIETTDRLSLLNSLAVAMDVPRELLPDIRFDARAIEYLPMKL